MNCIICDHEMVVKPISYDHGDKQFFGVPMRVCVNEKCPGLASATILHKQTLSKPRQF